MKLSKAIRHDRDDYFYRQRGESTVSNIEEWRFPDWIKPGMLIELTSKFSLGKFQKINTRGLDMEPSQPLYSDKPVLVMVVKLTDNRGYLDGLLGETLYRFSGKMDVKRAQEGI